MSQPPGSDDDVQRASEVLARNVQQARLARGLTQEELGSLSGLARARINLIETGRANINPTVKTLVALAHGFSIPSLEAYRLLSPEGLDNRTLQRPPNLGEKMPPTLGFLSIELPAGEAFEAARAWSAHSGRPIPLIDPSTREVAGIAGKLPDAR